MTTTWTAEFKTARSYAKDESPVVAIAADTPDAMTVEFDAGWGGTEGPCITIWTEENVYFPACYDGSEWMAWVPRNPNGEATCHVGGG